MLIKQAQTQTQTHPWNEHSGRFESKDAQRGRETERDADARKRTNVEQTESTGRIKRERAKERHAETLKQHELAKRPLGPFEWLSSQRARTQAQTAADTEAQTQTETETGTDAQTPTQTHTLPPSFAHLTSEPGTQPVSLAGYWTSPAEALDSARAMYAQMAELTKQLAAQAETRTQASAHTGTGTETGTQAPAQKQKQTEAALKEQSESKRRELVNTVACRFMVWCA